MIGPDEDVAVNMLEVQEKSTGCPCPIFRLHWRADCKDCVDMLAVNIPGVISCRER